MQKDLLQPVIVDLLGTSMTSSERQLLQHELVGGVILFARNCNDPQQVRRLTDELRAVREDLLILVDQEGGRVQRMRAPLTVLPPMAALGKLFDQEPEHAEVVAEELGWLMAIEVLSLGVDVSLAPVLDLDRGNSTVIGDRAFHHDPFTVTQLASAFCRGMLSAGMAPVGKHFPGHGAVAEDSHTSFPRDARTLAQIKAADLIPFEKMTTQYLKGVMPAHVVFPEIDDVPAGFSQQWIQQVLRQDLGFEGYVFSDDLSMAAAGVVGDVVAKADAAWKAGCDALLVCNNPSDADYLLANWQPEAREIYVSHVMVGAEFEHRSLSRLRAEEYPHWESLNANARRQLAIKLTAALS